MKRTIAFFAGVVLMLLVFGSAFAETILPNPATIDMEDLENRYVTTNLEYKGNGIVTLTLLENEQYDAEVIRKLQAGDVIRSGNEEITVETMEWDGPDLFINSEILLCDTDDGTFERVMENDMVPQLTIGTLDCEIEPCLTMLDWVDPVSGDILENVAVRSGEELIALLESGAGPSFAVENVHTLFDHYSQPMLIWRFYSPAQ